MRRMLRLISDYRAGKCYVRGDAGHTEQEITYLIEGDTKSFLGLEFGGELIISDIGMREHVRDVVIDMANHVHSCEVYGV